MPLVVPTIGNDSSNWPSKLLGKKLTESVTDSASFAKKDLPQTYRIVTPGAQITMDYRPDRLTVYVNQDGTVIDVQYC